MVAPLLMSLWSASGQEPVERDPILPTNEFPVESGGANQGLEGTHSSQFSSESSLPFKKRKSRSEVSADTMRSEETGTALHPGAFELYNEGNVGRKVSYSSEEEFLPNGTGRSNEQTWAKEAYPVLKSSLMDSNADLSNGSTANVTPALGSTKAPNTSVQSILSQPNAASNDSFEEAAATTTEPLKKKRKRATGYTKAEVERLLEAVGCVQPTCDEDWESVKIVCETMSPPEACVRTVKSLKLKFSSVSLKLVMKALATKPVGASALDLNPLEGSSLGSGVTSEVKQGAGTAAILGTSGTAAALQAPTVSYDTDATTVDNASQGGEDTVGDAEKLSDAMIGFFESFNAANGMVLGKGKLDSFVSRLETLEHNVDQMKDMMANINANTTAILMALQKP